LASRLADVVTGREEFVVIVGDDPEGMPGKSGTLPDETARLGNQGRAGGVDDLVGHGLLGDFVDSDRVDNIPGAAGLMAVISRCLEGSTKRGLLAVEAVSVVVLW